MRDEELTIGRSQKGRLNVKKSNRNPGPALIILAACFWGSMGIFVRKLSTYGFSSIQIVAIRVTLAALVFCVLLLVKDPGGFRISLRDIPLFLGLGFGSILFFTVCYFTAITMMPLSTAAILLYTSPIWIMLMSVLFFREKLTARKLLALVLAFAGCVLVSGVSGGGMTAAGLLIGLGSGIGYGMISKFAAAEDESALLFLCFLTAVITAVIPFLAYTLGLRTVEASRAGILATVEPMVAALIGVIVFSEPITIQSGAGILLILTAVILLNCADRRVRIDN